MRVTGYMITVNRVLLVLLVGGVLLISGCGSLPPFPEVYQCTYMPRFSKFRCTNTRTHARVNLPLNSPRMDGAQCLSIDDYEKAQHWIETVKQIAERRCN